MKTFIKPGKTLVALIAVLFSPLLISTMANACDSCYKHVAFVPVEAAVVYAPTATCTNFTTGVIYPSYVCCQLLSRDRHGHIIHVWRDTWVKGVCSNAHPNAILDVGCSVNSPVFGTCAPIQPGATCQFAYSTK